MKLNTRTISKKTGTEGPKHDPYSFEEFIYECNGKVTTLHMGLGVWMESSSGKLLYARSDAQERAIIRWFEIRIGMTMERFNKAYYRVHPYFEDPMGSISDYI